MLDFVDETFDQIAFFVKLLVIVPLYLAVASRGDDCDGLFGCDQRQEWRRIIGSVSNGTIKLQRCEQGFSLGDIMAFSASQGEA